MIPEKDSSSLFGKPATRLVSPFKKLDPEKFLFAVDRSSPRISPNRVIPTPIRRISSGPEDQAAILLF